MSKEHKIALSASAITTFKACPWKYRNAYHHGIRKEEKAEALRIGSIYHAGQEIAMLKPGAVCRNCAASTDKNCVICEGTGFIDDPMQAIARLLNHKYDKAYPGLSVESRMRERAMILYSLFAYVNVYDKQDFTIVAPEVPFGMPLIHPETHRPVPGIMVNGVIDKIIRWNDGTLGIMEHKSTSGDIDPSSDYWGSLRLDTQTTLYLYACQRLQAEGDLAPYGVSPKDPPISEIIYDVWRKPQIKPKNLSKEDSLDFIMTGDYMGGHFDVDVELDKEDVPSSVVVEGETAELTHAKTKKREPIIRETESMFGLRIFESITDDPSHWFVRKPLSRTTDDIVGFERELYAIAMTIENMIDNNSWYHNEKQCKARSTCDYCPTCYSGAKVDAENVPAGFQNIFAKKG